ncbi:MAG: GspH/FimT family pseudopilin [Xanthomonadales bacterium]|nr:GspH/FimT family pseudopilin [Xanthomonadales bacterium]
MNCSPKRATGFTLVELLAVVGLLALASVLVVTSMARSISGAEARVAAQNLAAALRYTRAQAIIDKQQKVFLVDTENRSYQAPGRDAVELPEGMDLLLTTARSEMTSEAVGGIRFFPDGGATGGHVDLIVRGREYRVDVAWLTGETHLARLDEDHGP